MPSTQPFSGFLRPIAIQFLSVWSETLQTAGTFFCRNVLIGKSFGIQDVRFAVLVTAVPHGAKDIPDTLQLPCDIFQSFS
jgi:hypothetical protein